ncbi:PD-(D/E)XK nuclease family protein [Sulfurimonas sp.]|nr:PD-(D/E)XK nuclease family protein [Sulfurimonas sp.]
MQNTIDSRTIVLPSARAIRHEQLSIQESTLFLPDFITMSEFISKLCVVKNFKTIDDDSRVLLLLEASDFNAFDKLQIQRNFFTFTKNSSYIFKFFEELSAEMYDISSLDTSDIYGEFEEHISILQELYRRYEILCSEKGVLDKIFLPKLYRFNESYAASHKNIELHVEGHLTNFELELLGKCCEFSDVNLVFTCSKFNTKMQSKFTELGFELEIGKRYKLSLNTKEILEQEDVQINKNISCDTFSEPILQVAYVKKKIYDFMLKGYSAEDIAVILPDEKFAPILRSFDDKSNFNFAMGEPFNKTKIYEKLNSTCKYIEQDSKENLARAQRVGDEFYVELLSIYHTKVSELDVVEFLSRYKESFSDKRANKIYDEELYSLKNILAYMKDMSVKSLLSVFLQRLAGRTLDDVRGGKVTVMGVLETRAVEFDAVVIVDFSDSNVPKRSDKDMFLNTSIREMASLPTMSDRESLQKHYYESLINNSKEVAISYVNSAESSGSRFLKQLGIKENNEYHENEYTKILFEEPTLHVKSCNDEIKQEYSFKEQKLSATRLKAFLTCKRKYYYKYVQKTYGHEIPKDMPQEFEIGNQVHKALEELYTNQSSFESVEALKKALHVELDKACGKSELEKYLIAIQKRNLDKFCEVEIKRFKDGWKVFRCEEPLTCSFEGMTLEGNIDRIDKRENEIEVLDYKTGKYPLYTEKNFSEATDFQLEFYYLLASGFGNVTDCAYYDLKESKIVNEAFLTEKLEVLKSHIHDLQRIEDVNFELCADEKNCSFCEYKIMCGRE